ncbi:hypothetical protein [Sedimentibacter sp.]|nr:hypothetical protein [Sedimentibacter sp.]
MENYKHQEVMSRLNIEIGTYLKGKISITLKQGIEFLTIPFIYN